MDASRLLRNFSCGTNSARRREEFARRIRPGTERKKRGSYPCHDLRYRFHFPFAFLVAAATKMPRRVIGNRPALLNVISSSARQPPAGNSYESRGIPSGRLLALTFNTIRQQRTFRTYVCVCTYTPIDAYENNSLACIFLPGRVYKLAGIFQYGRRAR